MNKIISKSSKITPSSCGEWSLWVFVVSVDDIVPDSMKFVSRVVVLKLKFIATLVSIRELLGVSIHVVEGLMDITVVVD